MEITHSKIEGCFTLRPTVRSDERGYFMESFNERDFAEATGITTHFVQDNQSFSRRGVLRGLHYQVREFAQAKLVRALQGEIFDVVVDLRPGSRTFGEYVSVVLSEENKLQMYIPRGCAHGFAVLSDTATFFYKCDNFYSSAHEGGLIYNDPDVNIEWPLDRGEIILSERDRFLPELKNARPVW